MGNSAQRQTPNGDVDHGFQYVEAGFVVAHQSAPIFHPAKGSFDDPASGQCLAACCRVRSAQDFQLEIAIRRLVEQPGPVIRPIGEQSFEPRLSLAGGDEDRLPFGTIGDVCCGQIHHQRHVVVGLDQHTAHKAAKPSVDRMPGTEIGRQHSPTTAIARHVADRVQHLTKVNADLPATAFSGPHLEFESAQPEPILHSPTFS